MAMRPGTTVFAPKIIHGITSGKLDNNPTMAADNTTGDDRSTFVSSTAHRPMPDQLMPPASLGDRKPYVIDEAAIMQLTCHMQQPERPQQKLCNDYHAQPSAAVSNAQAVYEALMPQPIPQDFMQPPSDPATAAMQALNHFQDHINRTFSRDTSSRQTAAVSAQPLALSYAAGTMKGTPQAASAPMFQSPDSFAGHGTDPAAAGSNLGTCSIPQGATMGQPRSSSAPPPLNSPRPIKIAYPAAASRVTQQQASTAHTNTNRRPSTRPSSRQSAQGRRPSNNYAAVTMPPSLIAQPVLAPYLATIPAAVGPTGISASSRAQPNAPMQPGIQMQLLPYDTAFFLQAANMQAMMQQAMMQSATGAVVSPQVRPEHLQLVQAQHEQQALMQQLQLGLSTMQAAAGQQHLLLLQQQQLQQQEARGKEPSHQQISASVRPRLHHIDQQRSSSSSHGRPPSPLHDTLQLLQQAHEMQWDTLTPNKQHLLAVAQSDNDDIRTQQQSEARELLKGQVGPVGGKTYSIPAHPGGVAPIHGSINREVDIRGDSGDMLLAPSTYEQRTHPDPGNPLSLLTPERPKHQQPLYLVTPEKPINKGEKRPGRAATPSAVPLGQRQPDTSPHNLIPGTTAADHDGLPVWSPGLYGRGLLSPGAGGLLASPTANGLLASPTANGLLASPTANSAQQALMAELLASPQAQARSWFPPQPGFISSNMLQPSFEPANPSAMLGFNPLRPPSNPGWQQFMGLALGGFPYPPALFANPYAAIPGPTGMPEFFAFPPLHSMFPGASVPLPSMPTASPAAPSTAVSPAEMKTELAPVPPLLRTSPLPSSPSPTSQLSTEAPKPMQQTPSPQQTDALSGRKADSEKLAEQKEAQKGPASRPKRQQMDDEEAAAVATLTALATSPSRRSSRIPPSKRFTSAAVPPASISLQPPSGRPPRPSAQGLKLPRNDHIPPLFRPLERTVSASGSGTLAQPTAKTGGNRRSRASSPGAAGATAATAVAELSSDEVPGTSYSYEDDLDDPDYGRPRRQSPQKRRRPAAAVAAALRSGTPSATSGGTADAMDGDNGGGAADSHDGSRGVTPGRWVQGRPPGSGNLRKMQPTRVGPDGKPTFSMRSTKFTGVYRTPNGRWRAQFCHGGCVHQLGLFDTEAAAAQMWDQASLVFRGKGCQLNFPNLADGYDMEVVTRKVHEILDMKIVSATTARKSKALNVEELPIAQGAIQPRMRRTARSTRSKFASTADEAAAVAVTQPASQDTAKAPAETSGHLQDTAQTPGLAEKLKKSDSSHVAAADEGAMTGWNKRTTTDADFSDSEPTPGVGDLHSLTDARGSRARKPSKRARTGSDKLQVLLQQLLPEETATE